MHNSNKGLALAVLFIGLALGGWLRLALVAWAAATDYEDPIRVWASSAGGTAPACISAIDSDTTAGSTAGYFETAGGSNATYALYAVNSSSHNDAYGLYSDAIFTSQYIDLGNRGGGAPANPSSGLGRLYWKSDNTLHVVDSTGTDTDLTAGGGGGGMTSFTLAGDSGGGQSITNGNTLSVLGGTNGIDTVDAATDKVTLDFDATEVDAVTWSAGGAASRVWTWNNSGSVDPTFTFGDGVISTNGDFGLPTGGNILVNSANPRRSVMLRAYEMWASTTQGATGCTKGETTTNKQNFQQWEFSGTALAKQYVEFSTPMPDNWDGGTVYAKFYWSVGSTSTNGVVWGCQGRSYGDAETIDQAWGTAQEVTDNGSGTANQYLISAETAAITLSGTPAGGEMVMFRIYRDATNASDTLTATAHCDLHAVKIEYTIQDYGE